MEEIEQVDIVLAEVSRPSPAVSFELGLAAALDIPIVYIATEGTRVSPVFGPVVEYPRDASDQQLSKMLANLIERALVTARSREPSGPRRTAQALDLRPGQRHRTISQVEIGEQYDGVVVHVDAASGYVLVGAPKRPTAMLHARNLRKETAAALAEGRITAGDRVRVRVADVDTRRNQIQLEALSPVRHIDSSTDEQLDLVARLYKEWTDIEQVIEAAEKGTEDLSKILPPEDVKAAQSWYMLYKPEFAVIRDIRNRLSHGEPVSDKLMRQAVDYVEEARAELERVSDPRTRESRRSIPRDTSSEVALRESHRARLDALAPRVLVLCDVPDWPPLIDRTQVLTHEQHKPRLLSPHSLRSSPWATNEEYAFDRDKDYFLWFCSQGLLRNEGNVSARIRLEGEAQFIKLRADEPDPRKRQRLPLTDDEPLNQERLLRPGEEVLFEWAAGHTLGEWAEAFEQPEPSNANGSLFFTVVVTDATGLSTRDYIYIEATGQPLEPVPGTSNSWRVTKRRAMSTLVYPTVRQYLDEATTPPEPPWSRQRRDHIKMLPERIDVEELVLGSSEKFTWRLSTEVFDRLARELMRRDDDIPLRFMLQQIPAEASEIVISEFDSLSRLLDQVTSFAALALTYERYEWFRRAVDSLVRVYELGFDTRGVERSDIPAARLWLYVIAHVYALGGLAVRLQTWEAVRLLANRSPSAEDFSYNGSWLRHALTSAARAKIVDDEENPGLIARAHNVVRAVDSLHPDVNPEADATLNSLCQFDALGALVVIGEKREIHSRHFYTNFARYYSARTEPALTRLITDPDARSKLFSGDDELLANSIKELDRRASEEGFRYSGWTGIENETVLTFLRNHP